MSGPHNTNISAATSSLLCKNNTIFESKFFSYFVLKSKEGAWDSRTVRCVKGEWRIFVLILPQSWGSPESGWNWHTSWEQVQIARTSCVTLTGTEPRWSVQLCLGRNWHPCSCSTMHALTRCQEKRWASSYSVLRESLALSFQLFLTHIRVFSKQLFESLDASLTFWSVFVQDIQTHVRSL